MIRIICAIVFVFSQLNLSAQPGSCLGQTIQVVDDIRGFQKDSVEIQVKQIRYKDPRYPGIMDRMPLWSNCVDEDSLNLNRLYLYPSNFLQCPNYSVKSESNQRYYLIGQAMGGVLTIKNEGQCMYIVQPDLGSHNSNTVFYALAHEHLARVNFQTDKKGFYNPGLYFPPISFKAGVFFLEDYYTAENFKEFKAAEIAEFHKASNSSETSPLEYWRSEITFYSPYKDSLHYSKVFEGRYSEQEAIDIIVRNSPKYINDILDHGQWMKYTKDKTRTESDNELRKFLFDLKAVQNAETDSLFEALETDSISEKEFLQKYQTLKSHHLYSILENDFELTLLFNKYILKDKERINGFQSIFDDSYHLKEEDLKNFLTVENSEKE